ncbi:MAG TPA: PKD domain-containing protein [Solirubrobacteraceae bacterium]|nr:PKD domain-containing protein [Solirubrobacteraceae bacterium]
MAPTTLSRSTLSAPAEIAIDANGDTLTALTRSDGANTLVFVSARPAGGTFPAPSPLSAPGENASCPVVKLDDAGDATVAWLRSDGANKIVQAAYRSASGSFSQAVDLSAPGQDASCPQLVVGAQNESTVAWVRSDGATPIAQTAYRLPGAGFSPAVDLSAVGYSASDLDLAGNAQGDATVAWVSSNPPADVVTTAHRPAGGAFIASADLAGSPTSPTGVVVALDPAGVSTIAVIGGSSEIDAGTVFTTGYATVDSVVTSGQSVVVALALAVAARGTAVLTWRYYRYTSDPTSTELVEAATRPGARTGWTPATTLASTPTQGGNGHGLSVYLSSFPGAPVTTVDPSGDATVAWVTLGSNLLAATQPAGGTFGSSIGVSEPTEIVRPGVIAAQDDAGDYTIAWLGSSSPGACGCAAHAASMPAGAAFGPPADVSRGSGAQAPLTMAINGHGDGAAAWVQSDGSSIDARVAGYQRTPPALDQVHAAAGGSVGAALAFSISARSLWSALSTTWAWGDGSADTAGAAVTHAFGAPGTYSVTATTTDELGNRLSSTSSVTIATPQVAHLPTAQAAVNRFLPLLLVRASRLRGELGELLGIASLKGSVLGETVTLRCVAKCVHALRQKIRLRRRADLHRKITLRAPLVLRAGTRVEIALSAPGLLARFDRFGFARNHHGLSAHIAAQGCLSASGAPHSCP